MRPTPTMANHCFTMQNTLNMMKIRDMFEDKNRPTIALKIRPVLGPR